MIPKPASPDWEAIRRRYIESDAAVDDIAGDAGITLNQFHVARRRGKWKRLKPRGAAPPLPMARRTSSASSSGADTGPGDAKTASADIPFVIPPVPTDERDLLARFGSVIWLKLLQLEESMRNDLSKKKGSKRASSSDHEREVRAVNTLIENVGKKKEMEAELARQQGTLTDPDLAREAERYRREFTEHLEKLLDGKDKP